MVQAIIQQGRVELREPIPPEWEDRDLHQLSMTPDDPLSDLDDRLAALHAMGPMEFEPGERNAMAGALRPAR